MTTEQKYFISLSRAAIFDETPPAPPEGLDWQWLWDKSKEQNLTGLLASAIEKLPDERRPENYEQWYMYMLQTAMLMGDRFDELERMTEVLRKNDIHPTFLKGCVLKELYHPVECLRVMGDFDIWVDARRRKAAETVFEREGYTVDRNTLFSGIDNGENHWELFESLEDDFRDEPAHWNNELKSHTFVNPKGLRVLEPTYELAYVVIHAAKHITREGCGLRNMLDVALILKHEIKDIDLNRVYEICKSQEYERIFLYMLSAAQRWYGLEFYSPWPLPDSDRFMEYLLSYGVFGRQLDGKILAAQVVRREGDGVSPLRRIFFPPRKMIQHKYQYVKRSPLLLPVAWIHRFFYAVFVKKYSVKDMAEGLVDSLDYGNERENWLKELEIH